MCTRGRQNFHRPKRFWRFENLARRGRDEQPPLCGGLFWTQIRLHCAASIAAALDGRRTLRFYVTAYQQWAAVFLPSPLNLSIKDGGCAKISVGQRSSMNYEPVDDN
jgi:hypothetical protein